MTRSKFPGEFGPEHTGFLGSNDGWLGWDPGSDQVMCAWPQGWPTGSTTLTATLDAPMPFTASETYQEVDLGGAQQTAEPLTISTSVPVYSLAFPGVPYQVILQVTDAGLNWYVFADQVADVPASFGVQGGWQVTMTRLTANAAVPQGVYLRTSIDQLV